MTSCASARCARKTLSTLGQHAAFQAGGCRVAMTSACAAQAMTAGHFCLSSIISRPPEVLKHPPLRTRAEDGGGSSGKGEELRPLSYLSRCVRCIFKSPSYRIEVCAMHIIIPFVSYRGVCSAHRCDLAESLQNQSAARCPHSKKARFRCTAPTHYKARYKASGL